MSYITFENLKPIVKLPDDCITDIFQFIDDKSTLYSCLFVNRFFFHLAIPKLWNDPFSFTIPTQRLSLIIRTYIKCLPQDRIKHLLDEGIINTNGSSPSSIEYHKYLVEFEYIRIIYSIHCWCVEKEETKLCQEVLTNEIFENLFFNQVNKMRNLIFHINYHTMYLINDENIQFIDITSYRGSSDVLSQIQEFDIEYHFEEFDFNEFQNFDELEHLISLTKNLLNSLISRNKTIKCLCLDYKPFVPSTESKEIMRILSNIIEQQQNLKTLDISDATDSFGYKRFYNSLISQSNCLTFLRLEFQITLDNFLLLMFELKSLETIELPIVPYEEPIINGNQARENRITFESITRNTVIKFNLKNIFFLPKDGYPYNKDDSYKVLQTLLEYSNKTLETLTFSLSNNKVPSMLINCPNITHLSTIIDNNNLISCLKLIVDLPKLNHLKLKYSENLIQPPSKNQIFFDEIIIWDLIYQIPTSLKVLEFDFMISSKELRFFLLDKCRASLNEITFHNKELITAQHFKVLTEYAKQKKSLKKFRYHYIYLNDDFYFTTDDDMDERYNEYSSYYALEELERSIPNISDPIDFITPFYEY
ncbi:6449_t:CDS:1 [Funneliformis geosporum]|uniref:11071_t:CDS:1 n=1 Tax=Funneliformis geosporum TaxID=1117311 RepID=A0A9W4SMP4_9GLOM|nr:6449_t:CDS:1 [Funneliformis geosporum]CAI2175013.1 11071_t:CDS:1 [Funneliformis geosporum]